MTTQVDFLERLGITIPIIQAPMAGATTPDLIAAVSQAGGLGSHGAAYLTPDQIRNDIAAIRARTDRPFNINLFAGGRDGDQTGDPDVVMDILGEMHADLGIDPPRAPIPTADPLADQLAVVMEANVPIVSFTFGCLPAPTIADLKHRGTVVIGTATTVREARVLEAAGVDAIVAQGSEAGAHRGTFAAPFEAAMIGTMALVPQVVDAVSLPVIASGGIMDGRGIVAAEALGAWAVQLGTAFLTCPETSIPPSYKQAIRTAQAEDTVITRAFSGRPARGIVNLVIERWEGREEAILPFPLQNAATRPLRNAAATHDDPRYLSLWSGQAGALARNIPAADLLHALVQEAKQVRAGL